ncbi:organic cation transporter protein-like [Mercenaria mercenaria]|uniref:organic cation transporter protein-like n=1 Tax=Mercenaria mercenaria TaxID=6596 RepID=UPI00234E4888|nr:organic cation transporter protein-like [Mercenaria mercenaria]
MKTDKITRLSCEFEKCQKLVYALVCLPAMFSGMQMFSTVFTLFIPKHRCSIPEIDNDTYKVQGHWHEIITNRSIPLVKGDDDMFDYAECEMFETNQNTTYNSLNRPINTSTIKCNKWVYDNFAFDETFITKENLVCEREIARANANMIYMSGVLTGAIATGIFSDMGAITMQKKIIQKWTTSNENLPENNSRKDAQDTMGTESVLKMLTIPTLLIRTLIMHLNWCVVTMVNFGLTLNIGNLKGDVYVNFAITSSMELIAYTVCFFTLNKLGRKVLHASTMILCGVACLSTIFTMWYADKSLYWITVVLTNIGKLGVAAAHGIIYLWCAEELFPTKVRNSGMGSSTMIAFVGSMVSPYIADLEKYIHGRFGKVLPPIVLGSLSVLAGLLSLVLPETNGRILPETVLDAVKFGKDDLGSKDTPSTVYYINDAFNKDKDTSEENKTGQ